ATDSSQTSRSSSAPCGIQAMPVWRSAGAGTVLVSARADPGRWSSTLVSKTSSPRGSVRAPAVLRYEGMANSGSEQFWDTYFTWRGRRKPMPPQAQLSARWTARSALAQFGQLGPQPRPDRGRPQGRHVAAVGGDLPH